MKGGEERRKGGEQRNQCGLIHTPNLLTQFTLPDKILCSFYFRILTILTIDLIDLVIARCIFRVTTCSDIRAYSYSKSRAVVDIKTILENTMSLETNYEYQTFVVCNWCWDACSISDIQRTFNWLIDPRTKFWSR